ncbi:MAG: tRNA preQ1(34) S-adenosylmethionine ribosyltransferase-isomerase QueA [Pyrinomonadaceae bacterium]
MRLADFDYELPGELIAQEPLARREASRMLLVDRAADNFRDAAFADLPSRLREGDVLVLNNTRVFPARLFGTTSTGASVEIFLIQEENDDTWLALARPGKRLSIGKTITFDERLSAAVLAKHGDGRVEIVFESNGDVKSLIDELGQTPLPPYIRREIDSIDRDRERYQTVYARSRGAIAAPTAGLHFTPDILQSLEQHGVTIAEITLHVGYGTFEPVRVDDLVLHKVSSERYEISAETADLLNKAKDDKRRVIAVGTTTTRALEASLARFGRFTAGGHIADLTVTPGFKFRGVDALLTNFHLPQSSLLVLVSTFAGHELIMGAYRHAVAEKYRFYSYGDCMLIS